MNSALYFGTVIHRRLFPASHLLKYNLFYMLIDLDELADLSRKVRFFSVGRPNLVSFRPTDFGDGSPTDLKQQLLDLFESRAPAAPIERISLLCLPRILGYVFNPISVYFGHDKTGRVRAVTYEVSNTFRERHWYVFDLGVSPAEPNGKTPFRHGCDKAFYVSPFLEMDCRYDFSLLPPAERLALGIRQSRQGKPVLNASFTGKRVPLTSRSLAGALIRIPFASLKIMAGIHWEAFKIWRKGIPVIPRTTPEVSPPQETALAGKPLEK
ncbi:DUF1365 domain-containing protein [Sneathiella chinensis]|uniref:DUF1365 domain-containing protein n=1 Tax=Sneathiella chinensis TaxID=349750 RepID=A0ABQ5U3M7_9PROT|nr:DUF1365 domain-containing protein [Sneathiella chinensis]GLQ05937.1 DUF1365 domain-containing protein [Sneathiella chinensis]